MLSWIQRNFCISSFCGEYDNWCSLRIDMFDYCSKLIRHRVQNSKGRNKAVTNFLAQPMAGYNWQASNSAHYVVAGIFIWSWPKILPYGNLWRTCPKPQEQRCCFQYYHLDGALTFLQYCLGADVGASNIRVSIFNFDQTIVNFRSCSARSATELIKHLR